MGTDCSCRGSEFSGQHPGHVTHGHLCARCACTLLEAHFAVFISDHCSVSCQVVVPNWTKNVQFQEELTPLASKDTCTHAYTELKIDLTRKGWLRHRFVVPAAQQAGLSTSPSPWVSVALAGILKA